MTVETVFSDGSIQTTWECEGDSPEGLALAFAAGMDSPACPVARVDVLDDDGETLTSALMDAHRRPYTTVPDGSRCPYSD